MKNKKITVLLLLSTTTLLAKGPADINGAIKIGTLGYGIDLSSPFNESLALRVNVNGLSISQTDNQDGTDYEGNLDLFTAGALLDYYPSSTNFRLTTGVYYNKNGFKGNAKPSAGTTVEIDGTTYTLGQFGDIGSLDSDVSFSKTAPYIGIGWGNNANQKGWGFTFDLGAMYHGNPEAKLNANINNQALATQITNDVAAEEEKINDDLSDFKFYPVVSLGVHYTF